MAIHHGEPQKTMLPGETLHRVDEEARRLIEPFVTSFIGQRTIPKGSLHEERIVPFGNLGSATFVSIGDACALLTADHVAAPIQRRLLKGEDVFLNVSSMAHRRPIPPASLYYIPVGEYSENRRDATVGPDLALFLILDSQIRRCAPQYYPLDRRNVQEFGGVDLSGLRWTVSGSPATFSQVEHKEDDHLFRTTHWTGSADLIERKDRDGFDYLTLDLLAGEHNFPLNYEGVSGGAAWVHAPMLEGTAIHSTTPFLAGVPYCQRLPLGNPARLYAHGLNSLLKAVAAVRRVLSENQGLIP